MVAIATPAVTIETSMVEGHAHTLFIDPVEAGLCVPGAMAVEVPV